MSSPQPKEPSRRISKGAQIAVAALVVVGLVGAYGYAQLGGEGTYRYFTTLTEFQSSPPVGKVRVHGFVAPGSIERDIASKAVRFSVQNDPPPLAGAQARYGVGIVRDTRTARSLQGRCRSDRRGRTRGQRCRSGVPRHQRTSRSARRSSRRSGRNRRTLSRADLTRGRTPLRARGGACRISNLRAAHRARHRADRYRRGRRGRIARATSSGRRARRRCRRMDARCRACGAASPSPA